MSAPHRRFSDAPPLLSPTAASPASGSPVATHAGAPAQPLGTHPVPPPAPPAIQCLWPADLLPFARRPLFVVVDSSASQAWGALVAAATEQHRALHRALLASGPSPAQMQALLLKPAHLPQLAVFASPIAVPPTPAASPALAAPAVPTVMRGSAPLLMRGGSDAGTLSFDEWFTNIAPRVGRLYTAFLHSPLMALCALCGIRGPSCATGTCTCPCEACRAAPSPVVLPLGPAGSAFNMLPGGAGPAHPPAHYRLHAHMHSTDAQQRLCEMESMASCQRRIQSVFDALSQEVFFSATALIRSLPASPSVSPSSSPTTAATSSPVPGTRPLAAAPLSPGGPAAATSSPAGQSWAASWEALAVFQHFAEDEYLRQFMLRHWFCYVVLRHHRRWGGRLADLAPADRARYMPQVYPAWPSELLENTASMNELVRALATELGVSNQFDF